MKKLMIAILVTLGTVTTYNAQADMCSNIPQTIPTGKYHQKTVPNPKDPLSHRVCVGGYVDC